jgi:hypothetical protein
MAWIFRRFTSDFDESVICDAVCSVKAPGMANSVAALRPLLWESQSRDSAPVMEPVTQTIFQFCDSKGAGDEHEAGRVSTSAATA